MTDSGLRELPAIWTPAGQQHAYRALLTASAYPGQVVEPAAGSEAPAWLAALAAVVDQATTLADPDGLLDAEAERFLAASPAAPAAAAFVLGDGTRPPRADWRPTTGSLLSPEGGATVILRIAAVGSGAQRWRLRGPGIATTTTLATDGLAAAWLSARAEWCADYPRGIELWLCDDQRLAALPRTTHLEAEEV